VKVGLVSPYDLLWPGGVNSHVRQLAHQLRSLGYAVKIMAPASGPLSADADTLIAPGGVTPIAINCTTARVDLSLAVFRWVRRIVDREGFDVVHVHEPLVPLLPLAALLPSKAANVGTFHAHCDGSHLHSLARPLLRPFFDRLDARIAVSAAALRSAAWQFPGHYKVVPLGIDVARYRKAATKLPEFDDGTVNVLFAGAGRPELRHGAVGIDGSRKTGRRHADGRLPRAAAREAGGAAGLPGDSAALASAPPLLTRDGELRRGLGKAGPRAVERYGLSRVAREIEAVYE
jgi:phosphatidylinositol alpha-mannosyltransferase